MAEINLIVVTGPTASGKTGFAAHLAYKIHGEIISADSRQVYRGMDLGTGKDYQDYIVHDQIIPYHLIDIREPGYKYNVYEFQEDFVLAFKQILSRDKMPMLVGGTGMYIDAVIRGYTLVSVPANINLRNDLEKLTLAELVALLKDMKPDLHNTTDITSKKRTIRAIEIADFYRTNPVTMHEMPEIRPIIFGVQNDRETRRKYISERLLARLNNGMIEEVEELLKKVSAEDLIFYGLEYKYITLYVTGKLTREEMIKRLEIAIHQFAKRQMTWFRKMERAGIKIHWLEGQWSISEKIRRAGDILRQHRVEFIN